MSEAPLKKFDLEELIVTTQASIGDQFADGVSAWRQVVEVVLAEDVNMRIFAEDLRAKIAENSLEVYTEVVAPLLRLGKQISVNVAGAVDVQAMVGQMLSTVMPPPPGHTEES